MGMGRVAFFQELMNALSMIPPSLAMTLAYLSCENGATCRSWASLIVLLATLGHAPVALVYHMRCAFELDKHPIDNNARRRDQTVIHTLCAAYSYALTGSWLYGAANTVLNAWCVTYIWRKGPKSWGNYVRGRMVTATVLYLLPMTWRPGQLANFGMTMALLVISLVFFIFSHKYFGGYGHTLFHLCMVPYGQIILSSADKVQL
mmetsp:Transcript_62835/g.141970  ORF Transcript_62835/g.141970 Transcript_62835/m.141970 type:complete len:204 (+) Transcript_62835:101-712(+)